MTVDRYKDHYASNTEKRWAISEDESSRERIRILKEVHDFFKREVPGITIAFTLFGSLSKGRKLDRSNAEKSDIDLQIFVDSDELKQNFDEISRKHPETEFAKFLESYKSRKDDVILDNYALLKMFIKLSFAKRLKNVDQIKTLSYEIKEISLSDDHSISSEVTRMYKRRPVDDDPADGLWSVVMCRYFHLDVGGSMKKYKEDFYRQLAERLAKGGEEARKAKAIWSYLVMAMKVEERYDERLPEKLQKKYPSRNLEEFLKKRGIEIPQLH